MSGLGADGAVLSRMDLHVRTQECLPLGGIDYIGEATITGTAIARFGSLRPAAAAGSIANMSLDAERRRARGPVLSRRDAVRHAPASQPEGR